MAIRLIFSQGSPTEVRVAAAAAPLAAGQMTSVGNRVLVAHAPVVQGEPAVFSAGPARYRATAATGDVPAQIAAGADVYLTSTGTLTDDDGKHVGYTPATIAVNATEFDLVFVPNGTALTA